MNLLILFGFKSEKDLKDFLDSIQKVTEIIGFTAIESVDLDAYQLHRVAYTKYKE